MTNHDLKERLLTYLRARNVAVLATAGPDGPWAAPVFFASDGFTLYFVTNPTTRHGTDIGAGARIAAAITEDHRDWQGIAGIQLQGFCAPVPEGDRPGAAAIFLEKYPFTRSFLDPAGPMYEKAGRKVSFYRLQPETLLFTDNAQGFGHRERLALEP